MEISVSDTNRNDADRDGADMDYREAYEREHEKCADLADKIVVLESEKEDLQFKLDRIKKKCNPLFRQTKGKIVPLRRTEGCPA